MERYVGCSGWHFKDWKERFYPEGLPQKEWLSYYAENFPAVEINNTFYKTPSEKTFQKWYRETPEDFRFSLKGSRYITHLKKLKEVGDYVKDFYKSIEPLQERVGCVLWQLPGNLKKNADKLRAFCQNLPKDPPSAIEFRHASWFDEEVRKILDEFGVIPCSVSSSFDIPERLDKSGKSVYIRFHGKGKERYKYFYDDEELQEWADAISECGAEKVFAFFNNDFYANGPMNGKRFMQMLEDRER